MRRGGRDSGMLVWGVCGAGGGAGDAGETRGAVSWRQAETRGIFDGVRVMKCCAVVATYCLSDMVTDSGSISSSNSSGWTLSA